MNQINNNLFVQDPLKAPTSSNTAWLRLVPQSGQAQQVFLSAGKSIVRMEWAYGNEQNSRPFLQACWQVK